MANYFYRIGEERYVWLDEDGERTSHHHKSVSSAFTYRGMLIKHLAGGKPVWSPAARRPFEPQGTGKPCVRLVKVRVEMTSIELSEDDLTIIEAMERAQ